MAKRDTVLDDLLTRCRTGSVGERCAAISDLEEMEAMEAVSTISELADFPDALVRANVASALGKLGDGGMTPVLLSLLGDADELVRSNAAESLGLLGNEEASTALAETLRKDEDPLVRLQAAEALGNLGRGAPLPALLEALKDTDQKVRAYAADSIGKLGAAECLPSLREYARSERSLFAKAFMLSAIHRLGDRDVLELLVRLSEIADDNLAVTIWNLALELATFENAGRLEELIERSAKSRPELRFEADDLIEELRSLEAPRGARPPRIR